MKNNESNSWVGMLVYAVLSLVIAAMWITIFDNIALGIVFSIVAVIVLILAFIKKKNKID
ncbi:MAG: hypothetical protein J6B17_03375 [Ruminococcus sp.]|nr:hypothetical protein [Ruminococcus sp.]